MMNVFIQHLYTLVSFSRHQSMKVTLLLALLATTLVSNVTCLPHTARAEDPCGPIVNNAGSWVLWDNAMSCIKGFPFNTTIRDEVLDYIEKTLQFYVFLDEAKNFDKKYSSHVDLIAGLEEIRQTNYANDYSFNVAIETLFDSLNDGHTVYENLCYAPYSLGAMSWTFRLPFPMVGLSDGGKLRFYVVNAINSTLWDDMPEYLEAFKKYTNIDPATYIGSEVIAIDGQPVLDVIKEFADSEVGISRDPSTRLNIALATGPYYVLGAFTQRKKIKKPAKATVTYTLLPTKKAKVQTVTVPWLALAPDISSSADYWSGSCLAHRGTANRGKHEAGITQDSRSRHAQLHKPKAKHGVSSLASGLINPLVPCDSDIPGVTALSWLSWGCFSQLDNETAVLTMTLFKEPRKNSLELELKNGFQQLEKLNLTKLIIDFSGNDGGSIASSMISL